LGDGPGRGVVQREATWAIEAQQAVGRPDDRSALAEESLAGAVGAEQRDPLVEVLEGDPPSCIRWSRFLVSPSLSTRSRRAPPNGVTVTTATSARITRHASRSGAAIAPGALMPRAAVRWALTEAMPSAMMAQRNPPLERDVYRM
jgi:hypothetical protein